MCLQQLPAGHPRTARRRHHRPHRGHHRRRGGLGLRPPHRRRGPREVTDTITGDGPKTLVDITTDDGSGNTGTVTATDEHPFWAPEPARWVDAIDLQPGTWLRTSAGTWTQVTATEVHRADDQQVHNLTVDDLHTYYVLADGMPALVHNDYEGCTLLLESVTGPNKETLPLPKGATGTLTKNKKGWIYPIEPDTDGLDPRVTHVRVMNPTTSGKYQYPNGYVVYMNIEEQSVNPVTGETISKTDPYNHIELP
ncbi:hypothetical protein J0910_24510 [Nocardiopsis sp. CNT-189]|uniref:polymorphic toxin-type HINT domain-containing protein n=1 Tax=Nocardiopsis oceanisediminis TaxID=2816862 RepID=UPI003B2CF1D1